MELDRAEWTASRADRGGLKTSSGAALRRASDGPRSACARLLPGIARRPVATVSVDADLGVLAAQRDPARCTPARSQIDAGGCISRPCFPAHAMAQLSMGIAPTVMLVNFAGNAGDALLGAMVIDRFLPRPRRFDQLRAVTLIVFCGGLLAPAITSLVVAEVFAWMGATASLWMSWRLRRADQRSRRDHAGAAPGHRLLDHQEGLARGAPQPPRRSRAACGRFAAGGVPRLHAAGGGRLGHPALRSLPLPVVGGHALRTGRCVVVGADARGAGAVRRRSRRRPLRNAEPDRERDLARPLPAGGRHPTACCSRRS